MNKLPCVNYNAADENPFAVGDGVLFIPTKRTATVLLVVGDFCKIRYHDGDQEAMIDFSYLESTDAFDIAKSVKTRR